MDVPDWIGELLLGILPRESVEELLVVVDIARDDVCLLYTSDAADE